MHKKGIFMNIVNTSSELNNNDTNNKIKVACLWLAIVKIKVGLITNHPFKCFRSY